MKRREWWGLSLLLGEVAMVAVLLLGLVILGAGVVRGVLS